MKTIESFRRIFSCSVVTESFCRQCTRKMDEKKAVVSYVSACLKYDAYSSMQRRNTAIERIFGAAYSSIAFWICIQIIASNVNFYFRILSNGRIFIALFIIIIARVDFYFTRMYRLDYFLCNILMYRFLSISSFYFVALFYDTT